MDILQGIYTDLGIRWTEETSVKVRKVIDDYLERSISKVVDEEADKEYKYVMHFFSRHDGSPEAFVDWKDYVICMTTFAPDFFGFD